MTKFKEGDRVRVICPSEDCEWDDGDGYGEDYERAIELQEAGEPLIVDTHYDGCNDLLIIGLNWFLLEQLEHWVEPNVNHVKVNLSTYKDDSNLTEEDKQVIKYYVKNNNLQELNVNSVV